MRYDELYPTTDAPCPGWCGLPAGHGYEGTDAAGNSTRHHQADFMAFDAEVPASTGAALTLTETAASDAGPVLPGDDLVIDLWVKGHVLDGVGRTDASMTGPQARLLAEALVRAADTWDAAVQERS